MTSLMPMKKRDPFRPVQAVGLRALAQASPQWRYNGGTLDTCPICRRHHAEGPGGCFATVTADVNAALIDPRWTELAPGEVVGDYQIECKLGEGGFGVVYKAVHPIIGKAVAIKVLRPEVTAGQDAISRFIVEARAVNQIRHRNIVDIFAFGTLPDHRHYFIMELLEGITLREHLKRRGRVALAEAIALLRPLARALDAAHRAGFAHRDLKPDNIFLVHEADGRVFPKLIDFGVAKLLDGNDDSVEHRTRSGAQIGTPRYMSPEQCRGMAVGHRTDVYSLGVVIYEMLTGRRPFEAQETLELMVQHTTVLPRPPSTVCQELSTQLDGPILHMLAKAPDDRPESVGAAIEALATATPERHPSSVKLYVGGVRDQPSQGDPPESVLGFDASDRSGVTPGTELPESRSSGRRVAAILAGIVVLAALVVTTAPVPWRSTPVTARALAASESSAWFSGADTAPTGSSLERPAPAPPAALSPESIALSDAEGIKQAPRRVEKSPRHGPSAVIEAKPTSSVSPPSAAIDCAFPYIFEPNGIRHIRPECLK